MTNNNKSDPAIPTLDDLVLVDTVDENTPEPASSQTGARSSGSSPTPGSRQLPRDNPFLPYEHLEQLAREREEFQKQFAQFSQAQQNRTLNGSTAISKGNNSNNDSLDSLARELTDKVLMEMRPQIEKRIRELIQEHQSSLPPDEK